MPIVTWDLRLMFVLIAAITEIFGFYERVFETDSYFCLCVYVCLNLTILFYCLCISIYTFLWLTFILLYLNIVLCVNEHGFHLFSCRETELAEK